MTLSSDVVITGLGPVTSIGIGSDEFMQALLAGRSGVGSLARRDDESPKPAPDWMNGPVPGVWLGAPIVGFDAARFVRPRKALKVMGRELQTAFAASALALEHSCLTHALADTSLAVDRVATVFGSQMFYGPVSELQDAVMKSVDEQGECDLGRFGANAMRDIIPLWMLKYLPNMPACHVGISIGATGANNTIVSGEVSSTSALIESIGVLHRGIADAVICAGSGTMVGGTNMLYRGDLPFPEPAEPIERSSRPHSSDSRGVVGGEAAAAVVVEFAEHAAKRSAAPIARVAGTCSRFAPPPAGGRGSALAIENAIRGALDQAGITADAIGLVVSHGTGDPLRDAAERTALQAALPGVPLTMPIAAVGHCGAASGAVNLVIAAAAIQSGTAPPSLLHGSAHPDWADRFYDAPRPLAKPAVMVLSHTGQGIANAVLLTAPR